VPSRTDQGYPHGMPSDATADLVRSTAEFTREFRETLTRNPRPLPGSPALTEAEGEPFAGDWGEHPGSDIFAATYLLAASCTDHLLGLADVLASRNAIYSAYTVTRAAVEAAALGCYLAEPDIGARERLRRTANYRLHGFSERVRLFEDLEGDYAAVKLAESQQRMGDFARSARHYNFTFRAMNDRGRPACVDGPQPSAMSLISLMLSDDKPQLGRLFQRLLSATAHSSIHGLARMLSPLAPNEGRPGEVLAAINGDARTLATELIAGPLAGHILAGRLEWFAGCDMTSLREPANQMLQVWAGVGEMQLPPVTP
jgi:hypothetical protein